MVAPAWPFRPGDLVRLKSGSPTYTVISCSLDQERGPMDWTVRCVYHQYTAEKVVAFDVPACVLVGFAPKAPARRSSPPSPAQDTSS